MNQPVLGFCTFPAISWSCPRDWEQWHTVKIISDLSGDHSASRFLEMESSALSFLDAGKPDNSLVVWSSKPALVVSGSDTRLPRFDHACRELAKQNIEVIKRSSGGSAVPQDPGVLSISLAFRPGKPRTIDQLYGDFCGLLAQGFAGLGLATTVSAVPGCFCDGRFNLVTGGRKLAGTAMKLKGPLGKPSMVLAHAVILTSLSSTSATDRVNLFYRLAGDDRHFRSSATTSVAVALERQDDSAAKTNDIVSSAMIDVFNRTI